VNVNAGYAFSPYCHSVDELFAFFHLAPVTAAVTVTVTVTVSVDTGAATPAATLNATAVATTAIATAEPRIDSQRKQAVGAGVDDMQQLAMQPSAPALLQLPPANVELLVADS
jgi:hypothetical protein